MMGIISCISEYLGVDEYTIKEIVKKAPSSYRKYMVPKKRGGQREIFHPAKETKCVQLAAIDLLYSNALMLPCIKGYVRGLKNPLKSNALVHAPNPFLLKMDFVNFFPSIKKHDFMNVCENRLLLEGRNLSLGELDLLGRIFFVFNKRKSDWFLGIGSPSSPFVSNWVMYPIDQAITTICNETGCNYTRYADDICISSISKEKLLLAETEIKNAIAMCHNPRLVFNDMKRRLASRSVRKRVTGLTITPRSEVKIPREMKRYIRSLIHKYQLKTISAEDKKSLSGYLSYLNDCEPEYFANLTMKYTSDIIFKAWKAY